MIEKAQDNVTTGNNQKYSVILLALTKNIVLFCYLHLKNVCYILYCYNSCSIVTAYTSFSAKQSTTMFS